MNHLLILGNKNNTFKNYTHKYFRSVSYFNIFEIEKYNNDKLNIFNFYDDLKSLLLGDDINTKNPDILWVSLGFPKQEKFMNLIKKNNSINTNMVGIGAVFEWVAGTKIKAPEWLANIGLEWLIRLIQEPKRLFRRYLVDNFLFIIYFIKQYIRN